MKYLFINLVAGYGSTGRLVCEKSRELMAQGHECIIAHGRLDLGTTNEPNIVIGTPLNRRIHGLETRLLDNHGFSSRLATVRFLKWVREYDPDVIWMHNIHGYYIHVGMLFDYLRHCGKEIRWTLHDCWAFTGHCSHFERVGCEAWKTGCGHCPQKKEYPTSILLDRSSGQYEKKKRAFTGIPNMTLYVPCQWLKDLLQQSFLAEYPVQVVYNVIDKTIFHPVESDFRVKNGLEGKKIVLGVSSMWDHTKGLNDFYDLADQLGQSYQVVLVGVPEEIRSTAPTNVLCLPRTENAAQLAGIYSAADVFVNPTYEDTYPTVNLEAVACGCRVVTYRTGGCPETVTADDLVVPMGDRKQLLDAVRKICGEKEDSR